MVPVEGEERPRPGPAEAGREAGIVEILELSLIKYQYIETHLKQSTT